MRGVPRWSLDDTGQRASRVIECSEGQVRNEAEKHDSSGVDPTRFDMPTIVLRIGRDLYLHDPPSPYLSHQRSLVVEELAILHPVMVGDVRQQTVRDCVALLPSTVTCLDVRVVDGPVLLEPQQ